MCTGEDECVALEPDESRKERSSNFDADPFMTIFKEFARVGF